jgi:hypothetical protein
VEGAEAGRTLAHLLSGQPELISITRMTAACVRLGFRGLQPLFSPSRAARSLDLLRLQAPIADRSHQSLVVALGLVGVVESELLDRTIQHVAVAQVARDHRGLYRVGTIARWFPTAWLSCGTFSRRACPPPIPPSARAGSRARKWCSHVAEAYRFEQATIPRRSISRLTLLLATNSSGWCGDLRQSPEPISSSIERQTSKKREARVRMGGV